MAKDALKDSTAVGAVSVTQSPMHRRQVGDVVAINHDDYEGGLDRGDEGTITGFANDKGSYLSVDFGDKGVHELTEDDVTRVS